MSHRFAVVLAALVLPLAATATPAQATPTTVPLGDIIPAPVEVHPGGAPFRLTSRTVIEAPPAARTAADRLREAIGPATGFRLPILGRASSRTPVIALIPGGPGVGYRLTSTRDRITIQARTGEGLFDGVQTLRQLLPAAIDARTPQKREWAVAGGQVVDFPKFAYRGAMLDEARHFHTPDEVKQYIEEIARFKVNYLHLHLADDQGWRIRIDSWPKLTQISGGAGTGVDGAGGGFLTKAEYQDLVRYAAARYITIVPEIDMPGHVNAAQVAYPELTCDGVAPPPRTDTEVGYSSLCTSKEVTYKFAEDVIRELAAITPGPYIHVGGDEAHATAPADYVAFEQRVLPLVAKYGKIAYGWHQIAQAPAASKAVAQFWGTDDTDADLVAAVAHGTKVIMSPANQAYLDMKYTEDTPLGQDWAALIEVHDAYSWNPATRVGGVPASAVLGVEAPLWSETLRDLSDIQYMAFPRLPAVAELGWSATYSWDSFRTRLGTYGPRWDNQGVNFYRSPQIAWS
jgi:hexosaminidase